MKNCGNKKKIELQVKFTKATLYVYIVDWRERLA